MTISPFLSVAPSETESTRKLQINRISAAMREMHLEDAALNAEEFLNLPGCTDHDPVSVVHDLTMYFLTLYRQQEFRTRMDNAHLSSPDATLDPIYFDTCGLNSEQLLALASCSWIADRGDLHISGPRKCGKSTLANALAVHALCAGFSVRYAKAPELAEEFAKAAAADTLEETLHSYMGWQLLIIDDLDAKKFVLSENRDILNLLNMRKGFASTCLIASSPIATRDAAFHCGPFSDKRLANDTISIKLHESYWLEDADLPF